MMNKFIFKLVLIIAAFALAITMTACSFSLSKQEKDAVKAFRDVLTVLPAEEKNGWYQIISPDGGAKFVFSNDCAGVAVDAVPFITAGLDAGVLDNVYESVFYKSDLGFSLPSWDMLNRNVKDTALAQFEADIKYFKTNVNNDTGHFSINFNDAVFEWANDIKGNKHGIVFTLNPEPLIAAGVDPEKVEGWNYVQVSVEVNGKTEQVWRFQKTIDLSDLI